MAVVYDFHLSIQSVKLYYMLGVVVAQAVMLVVEIVMMVRVYALYARNIAVKYVCVALMAGSIVIMLVGLGLTIPGDDFQPSSLMLSGPKSFAYFALSSFPYLSLVAWLNLQFLYYDGWLLTERLASPQYHHSFLAQYVVGLCRLLVTHGSSASVRPQVAGSS
ncbi:hypothetical protein ONZ45_g11123 [Pleurotus djamor]|nr:hypothetical protein ONZ45_g11123 [Pleurotus djamor]